MIDGSEVRVRALISGRVQGVFFRASAAEEARRLGVAGFVRNIAGGKVEAAFEGPKAAVEEMISWCRVGPPYAVVEDVELRPELPAGESVFRIL